MRYLLFLTLATLSAQESDNVLSRNENALKNAIAGIGRRPARLAPQRVLLATPVNNVCAVPLSRVPVDTERDFTARQFRPGQTTPMPPVRLPASPCDSIAR